MKLHEIELLIEKFYNGETSNQEELLLKEYLNKNDIPEQFHELRSYFKSIEEESGITKQSKNQKPFFCFHTLYSF